MVLDCGRVAAEKKVALVRRKRHRSGQFTPSTRSPPPARSCFHRSLHKQRASKGRERGAAVYVRNHHGAGRSDIHNSTSTERAPPDTMSYSAYLFERFCLFTYLPFIMYTALRSPGYFMHLT